MAEDHIFAQNGDEDYAENFAQLIGHEILAGLVVTGMGFSEDFTVPEVTIGTGLCFIMQDSESVPNGETRFNTNRPVQASQDTISLTDNDVNHIYVEPQFGTDDSPQYSAYTDTSNASADALKIGEIDTGSDSSTTTNRSPTYNDNLLWHEGNDGAGSGLDADTVDGNDAVDVFGPSDPTEVTSSRSEDTVYQNTTGSPLLVSINCNCVNAIDSTKVEFRTGSSSPPTNVGYRSREMVNNTDQHKQIVADFSCIVPDGHYYELARTITDAGVEFTIWSEQEL